MPGTRVAYLVSRFPKLSETFVLLELLELERQGIPVGLYPLQRERTAHVHPEAVPLIERAHYLPFLSPAVLQANAYFLRRDPGRYLRTLIDLLRGTWGSARFFAGALVFFPKIVAFARQMLEDGTTHIHAHFASHPTAAAFAIQRLTGLPYSFTAHGSDLHRDQTMLREKVREARAVVAVSEYNREVILGVCGDLARQKTVVIHCGVDPEVFHPPREEASVPRSSRIFRVLCTGTLHEVKGQAHLIDACARVRARGIDVHCEFIGDGPDRAALESRAERLGLRDVVHFHGSRPRLDVAKRLREADVVATPSVPTSDGRREGIPVALMEAMASGRPVVASRLSGIPELIEDGRDGLLTEPGNVDELAAAIEQLHGSPELCERLGAAARRRILADFDLSGCTRALALIFAPETEATEG